MPLITMSSSLLDEEDVDVSKLILGWGPSSPDGAGWVGEVESLSYLCVEVGVEEGVGQ